MGDPIHNKAVPGEGIGIPKRSRAASLFWCLVILVISEGCLSSHHVFSGGFYIETRPSSRVHLSDIHVRQAADELIISGAVSRRNTAFSGAGHIDVAVVSPDGVVVCQGNAPYTPKILPETPGARRHRPAHFDLRLGCDPPSGSTIRVAYHGKASSGDTSKDGHQNYAAPEPHDHGG